MEKKLFIFATLTYNHAQYIAEHLESIKFLIDMYGSGYGFKLVIADDGSKDNTIEIVNKWLADNNGLFQSVVIQADGINQGTCTNYTNMWKHINSDRFKVLAGDDVYSCYNIFKEAEKLKEFDFVSGIPLILIDGKIKFSKSAAFHMIANDVIYKDQYFIDRLRKINVINTPSLLYQRKFLQDVQIQKFVRKFQVVEDFPFMVKVAELYRRIKFYQSENVYIYYRRTSGSTYLVSGNKFDTDKISIFKYILELQANTLPKLLMYNRIFCYKTRNKFIKKIANLNYYIYIVDILFCLYSIMNRYFQTNISVEKYREHYTNIKKSAEKYNI